MFLSVCLSVCPSISLSVNTFYAYIHKLANNGLSVLWQFRKHYGMKTKCTTNGLLSIPSRHQKLHIGGVPHAMQNAVLVQCSSLSVKYDKPIN